MSCDHVMFFRTVLAIMSGGYDPIMPQPPRILQCPIVKDFLSQPVSEGFLLAFRFDLVFQFVEMLGRSIGSSVKDIFFLSKISLDLVGSSRVAQWIACWAHNPEVRGSKPRSALQKVFFYRKNQHSVLLF